MPWTKTCLTIVVVLVSALSAYAQQTEATRSTFGYAAPTKCWTYSNWSEAATFDPNSQNASEQLLAEPEVRAFIDDMIKRAGLLGPAMVADQSEKKRKLMYFISPKLTDIMLKRMGCFFIEEVQFTRDLELKKIKAALLVDAGDDAAKLADRLALLFSIDYEKRSDVTLDGIAFRKFQLSEKSKTELLIGNSNGLLMIGLDEQTITEMLKRIAAKQNPDWLTQFKCYDGVKRVSNFSYFNVKRIRDTLTPLGGPQAIMTVDALGLGNINSVETCSGFSQEQSLSRMLIRTDGHPEGLLDVSSPEGIQSTDIQQFPEDSLFAIGLSIDPNRVMRFLHRASLTLNGNQDDIGEFMQEMKRETGIDLKLDVIENLGKTWTLYNGAGDGWMSGLTLTGTVKDSDKLSAVIQRVIKLILMQTDGSYFQPKFTKRVSGDAEVFTFKFRGEPFPIEPSWAVANQRIILGLYPQAVETALQRKQSTALIDQAQFSFLTQPFSGKLADAKLLAMAYVDTPTQFEFTYPYLQMMTSMSRGLIQELNLPSSEILSELLNGIRLPPARTIHRHLRPTLVAIRQTESGLEFESHQTIPAIDVGYLTPLAVGMALPAVQQVRNSARQTVSMNNLRQQILAALNFESVFQRFPSGYSTNGDGDKLLSWRVHVLPFIEQNNLYDQFNLDEPWDSENNKRLIEKMPEVFRSPLSNAKPGMTVYRGIGGKTGVLGPPQNDGSAKGVGFGNITDGSSNTLFLVETSDQLAVPWTQPDEGLDPNDFDLDAIFGLYPSGTNAAYCDGSVHFFPDNIAKETFGYLMEMNDGNIVPDFGRFPNRPSRRARTEIRDDVKMMFAIDNGEVELTLDNMLNEAERGVIAGRQKTNALRQVLLAFHNYQSAHRHFPSAYTADDQNKPLLSWRVHLLPFLDEGQLYSQFRLDEPWDSKHNLELLERMPDCYDLADGIAESGKTTVLAIGGPQGPIQKPKEIRNGQKPQGGIDFSSIRDGSSNTVLLVEAGESLAVQWTKPTEFVPDEQTIKKLLARDFAVGLADGSAFRFPAGFPIETFKAMITMAGGENIGDWEENLSK